MYSFGEAYAVQKESETSGLFGWGPQLATPQLRRRHTLWRAILPSHLSHKFN
jgi:hypothetical protein